MFYGDVKVCADLSIASLSQRDVTAFIDMRNVERLEKSLARNTIHLHIKGYRTVTMRSIPENSKSAQHKIFLRDGTRWIESISRTWRDLCTKKGGRKILSQALQNRTYSNKSYCPKWISQFDKADDYARYRALRDRLKLAQSKERHGTPVVVIDSSSNDNSAENGGVGIFVENSMRLLEEIDSMALACAQQKRSDILHLFVKHFHEVMMINYESFTHDDVLCIRKRGQTVLTKPSLKLIWRISRCFCTL